MKTIKGTFNDRHGRRWRFARVGDKLRMVLPAKYALPLPRESRPVHGFAALRFAGV